MRRLAAVLVTAAAWLASASAHADTPPSVWQRAKDPNANAIYQLHATNELLLRERATGVLPTARVDLGQARAQAGRDRILRAEPVIRNDIRIQFDLAQFYEKLLDYSRASALLKTLIEEHPDHPLAEDGLHTLAEACGHLGDSACEKKAYTEILRRETEEFKRSTPLLNLAEAEMHLGNLRESIEGYRESLRVASRLPPGASEHIASLSVWGLAVALDRSGDRVTAEQQARFAMTLTGPTRYGHIASVGDIPGTYYYPSYEVLWYDGLGAAAAARIEPDRDQALRLWNVAENRFTRYIEGGEKNKDPWVAIAKARLAGIMAARLQTEKRPASPKKAQTEDELTF